LNHLGLIRISAILIKLTCLRYINLPLHVSTSNNNNNNSKHSKVIIIFINSISLIKDLLYLLLCYHSIQIIKQTKRVLINSRITIQKSRNCKFSIYLRKKLIQAYLSLLKITSDFRINPHLLLRLLLRTNPL